MKLIEFKYASVFAFLFSFYSCGNSGNFNIEGIVKNIENGKDGYTANILGKDGIMYSAVISIENSNSLLFDDELKVGDRVEVYGDTIHLRDYISITVTKMKRK